MDFDDDLDEHGQPKNRAFNAKRLKDRGVDELVGLCKGMIADNLVNEAEARFLRDWLETHKAVAGDWPGNILYARVYEFLRDGHLDEQEKAELLELMTRLSGLIPGHCDIQAASGLPFDQPLPCIEFDHHVFVLTGRFAFGTRDECIDAIHDMGGWVRPTVIRDTDYVIVGTLASRDWAHATHGRKIETALEWKKRGEKICIIPEDHWASYLV